MPAIQANGSFFFEHRFLRIVNSSAALYAAACFAADIISKSG
jgi:hypothetical protein